MSASPLECLLVSSASKDPWTTNICNPLTGSNLWSFKGAELQSATPSFAVPLANDYLMFGVDGQSLVLTVSLQSKERRCVRSVAPGSVASLVCSPDGTICCGAVGESIATWLTDSGSLLSLVSAHYQSISKLAMTDDGSLLISAGKDGSIVVFVISDLMCASSRFETTSQQQPKPLFRWQRHSLPIWCLCVSNGGCSGRVASGSQDQTVKLHSLQSGDLLLSVILGNPATAVAFDSAECHLFAGVDSGDIHLVRLYAWNGTKEMHINDQLGLSTDQGVQTLTGHKAKITCLSVSIDSCTLASGSTDHSVRLWHVESKQCIRVIPCKGAVLTALFMPVPACLLDENYQPKFPMHPLQKQVVTDCSAIPFHAVIYRSSNDVPIGNSEDQVKQVQQSLRIARKINKDMYDFAVTEILKR